MYKKAPLKIRIMFIYTIETVMKRIERNKNFAFAIYTVKFQSINLISTQLADL